MSFLFTCVFVIITATNAHQEYDFVIDREYLTPDCVEKLMITINGQFPAPEIRVTAGELVTVNVYNGLPSEAMTIHWHGLHQIDTSFMDGASKVSQCPIPPFSSFQYKFFSNQQPGTYFYHLHSGTISANGAFIIIPKDTDPYEYEYKTYDTYKEYTPYDEFIMFVSDHYHRNEYESQHNLLQKSFRWVFNPDSILINGKGIYDCEDNDNYECDTTKPNELCFDFNGNRLCGAHQRKHTRFVNYGTGGCDENTGGCGYEEFHVQQGEKYLFRIINPSPLSHLNVAFEKHTVTIIAVDANPIIPLKGLTSVDLHSGQRVDILVEMNQDADTAYWITAKIRSRSGVRYGPAILRYENNQSGLPSDVAFDELDQPAWDDFDFTRTQQNQINSRGISNPPSNDAVNQRIMLLSTQERFGLDNGQTFNGDKDTFDLSDMQSIITGDGSGKRPEDYCDSNENQFNLRWAFNRGTFILPDTPSLLSHVYTPKKFKVLANQMKGNYFNIQQGGVYDIVLQNYPACNGVCETHSIHFHGHHFWVLGYFEGEWTGSDVQVDALCTENCVKRDSVFLIADENKPVPIKGCGYTVIRFEANNPGVWQIHCHQSWHALMGKIALFYYNNEEIKLPDIDVVKTCGDLSVLDVVSKHNKCKKEGNPCLLMNGEIETDENKCFEYKTSRRLLGYKKKRNKKKRKKKTNYDCAIYKHHPKRCHRYVRKHCPTCSDPVERKYDSAVACCSIMINEYKSQKCVCSFTVDGNYDCYKNVFCSNRDKCEHDDDCNNGEICVQSGKDQSGCDLCGKKCVPKCN